MDDRAEGRPPEANEAGRSDDRVIGLRARGGRQAREEAEAVHYAAWSEALRAPRSEAARRQTLAERLEAVREERRAMARDAFHLAVRSDDRSGEPDISPQRRPQGVHDTSLVRSTPNAQDYGEMIGTLTGGELAANAVATDVAAHIDHIVSATDAYAAGDFPAAFAGQRTAYAATFTTGKAVSGAVVAQTRGELPAGFDSAPARLRSALRRLLGEHVELAFDATRAVVAESPAAPAAAEALNENTQEILEAMQAALGRRGATAFSDAWAGHIDAVVQFAVAVADGDEEGQSRARAALDTFPGRLQEVLTSVSGGQVAAEAVVAALKQHDQQLLQQVTAFAAADFATSHDLAYAGYEHMVAIADTVALAIRGRTAGTAPEGGADTGGGGIAR